MLYNSLFRGSAAVFRVCSRGMRVCNAHREFEEAQQGDENVHFAAAEEEDQRFSFELPQRFPVKVWKDFVDVDEEQALVELLEGPLNKMQYSQSHFDSVICNFRETLLPLQVVQETPRVLDVVERVKQRIFADGVEMADIHVLDIAEDGFIAPHVDTEFTGGIVAGLTLLSDAVVTFQPHVPELQESLLKEKQTSASTTKLAQNSTIVFSQLPKIEYVPARSLYILTKDARYKWTHAIEVGKRHCFNNQPIKRTRRISLMFRDELPPVEESTTRSGSLEEFL